MQHIMYCMQLSPGENLQVTQKVHLKCNVFYLECPNRLQWKVCFFSMGGAEGVAGLLAHRCGCLGCIHISAFWISGRFAGISQCLVVCGVFCNIITHCGLPRLQRNLSQQNHTDFRCHSNESHMCFLLFAIHTSVLWISGKSAHDSNCPDMN